MQIDIVDRIVLPRIEVGVDWGAQRRVLAVRRSNPLSGSFGDRLLFIRAHCLVSTGARGFGRTSVPAELVLESRTGSHNWREIAKGRITRAVLAEHAGQIDAWFDCPGLTQRLDLKKTVRLTADA